MYEGYLAFGGNEIINSERARGYAESAACPMMWFKGERSTQLPFAVGDSPYDAIGIDKAPWYDPTLPDVSRRFYGAFGLSIKGMEDSTRKVAMQQNIDDGGMPGRPRSATRDVVVTAMLVGRGEDAVGYGQSWLNAVLDSDACGQVSEDCGTAELATFVAAPPERQLVRQYNGWTTVRVNNVLDPDAQSLTYWGGLNGNLNVTLNADMGQTPTAVRHTRTATGAARLSVFLDPTYYQANREYLIRMKVRGSVAVPGTVTATLRPQFSSTTGQTSVDISGRITSNTTEIAVLLTSSSTAPSALPALNILWSGGSVNDWVEVTDLLVEPSSTANDYFSYNTPAAVDEDNQLVMRVVGGAGSASELQTRTSFFGNESDEMYTERVDLLRRFMRRGAVTSGSTALSEVRVGPFWAREVQFVISGGPHVIGMTKAIDVQPSIPAVVQDVPYNLIPYPSGEIAMSTEVTVARNLSTNPSVETSSTGWVPASSVANSGYITTGRATDIFAVGGASAYSRLLPNDSTSIDRASATLDLYQDVTLEAGTSRRISVNIWAAALVLQGSSPGTLINSMQVVAQFYTSANALISSVTVGTATSAQYSGRAYSLAGIAVPSNATKVRILCRASVVYSNVAQPTSDIRIYADALAVTIP